MYNYIITCYVSQPIRISQLNEAHVYGNNINESQ